MSEYPNPLLEQLFVAPESTYGALAAVSPELAIRHIRAAFNYTQERAEREDKRGSRGVAERVSRRKNLKYEIEAYAMSGGSPGIAPDVGDLLQAHGLNSRSSSITQVAGSSTPTTSSCALADAEAAQVGDAMGFIIDGEYCIRSVTASNAGLIEWTPDLPSAPVSGDTVYPATTYRPQANPTNSVSLWRFLDGVAFAYPGCVGQSWELVLSGGQEARLRFAGLGGDEKFAAADVLSQSIDDEQIEISVTHPERFEAGIVLSIEQEFVKILAVDTPDASLNVQRAWGDSVAASHNAGCAVTPRQPEVNLTGSPIAGICGRIELDGGVYEITEAVLKCEEGLLMRQAFGADRPVGFTYPERRRVRLSLSGYLTSDTASRYGKVKKFEAMEVFIQAGKTPGSSLAIHAPRFEADIPEITVEPGRETPLKLSGLCLENEGDDEIRLAFA